MANVLKMSLIESIRSLHAAGYSRRRIARELGIDRGTVGKYLGRRLSAPKPANAPTGYSVPKPATLTGAPAPASKPTSADPKPATNAPTGLGPAPAPDPSDERAGPSDDAGLAPLESPTGESPASDPAPESPRPGPRSACEPYRQAIEEGLDAGLSLVRVWQDLKSTGAAIGYDSLRRFARRIGAARPLPFRRMECGPGEEAQVDFGVGAPVVGSDGKRRRTWVFRIVLSHSRKGYSEATFTQTTEDFFRCLENAFAHFGGVPKTLVIDNLKAAVAHPDWFDPVLTPKVQSFCRHHGTTILPTKPYMPRHKGKVESGVKYVKNNALKARTFATLEEENTFLAEWERMVADTRIHGTTKKQVKLIFEQVERGALLPLARDRFACFHEARRKVSRDGHVEVAKAYYSVPPEYLTREVWVRWDSRLVRIFNARFESIAVHGRHEQGRFSTHPQHIAREKINGLERGAEYLLKKVGAIGPRAREWSQAMLHARGVQGTRVLQGLLALTKRHASETLENACEIALSHGRFHLKSIRNLANRGGARQEPLPFLDEHPIIRPLSDYGAVVERAFQRQEFRSSMSEGLRRHGRTETTVRAAHENSPSAGRLGCADWSPPWSGYPLSGCASAEPDSVSPNESTIVPPDSSSTNPEEFPE